MKVLRYSAVAAVAIFAAACGDKVTVAGPTAVTLTSTTTTTTTTTPVAPGKINSIAVAPAAVTLTIGQAVTLVAAVNADPGVATTVTWSTSDATKVTVVAGLVTAVAATPGVAICATSTVNVGVKGCASAVVVAASATVPATVSIAGVYGATTTTPITPTSVTGSVSAMVNVDPGTETISKVYLKIGSVVADSQVFSAAQSAALRNAVETANEAGAQAAGENMADASSSILLTFNSAAYNATTGAVSFANGASALSVVLYVGTTARSTATYSTNLTLNNTDVVYGTYTNPSTTVNATDASGYQWTGFGGGATSLKVIPVTYTGKTPSSVTVAFYGTSGGTAGYLNSPATYCPVTVSTSCIALPSGADTSLTQTVTGTAPYTATFGLYDRAFVGGSLTNTIATGIAPTVTINYTDGSSLASQAFANATALSIRPDNQGPGLPTISNPAFNASTAAMRGVVSFAVRPTLNSLSPVADSGKLINTFPTDVGVSAGTATNVNLLGMTFKAFRNAGGTAVTATDTLLATTEITAGTSLASLAETGAYCVMVRAYDALGNVSVSNQNTYTNAAGVKVAKGCSTATGQRSIKLDNTAPVTAFAGIAGGDWSSADTATTAAITAGMMNYFYTVTETNTGTDSISVCYYNNVSNVMTVTSYISSDAATTTCV